MNRLPQRAFLGMRKDFVSGCRPTSLPRQKRKKSYIIERFICLGLTCARLIMNSMGNTNPNHPHAQNLAEQLRISSGNMVFSRIT